MKNTAILLINCPDRKGIVFAIARFLYEHGANITHSDQHRDDALGLFFLRVEWALEDFDLDELSFRKQFVPVALQFSMSWKVEYCNKTPVIAILVSSYLHCLVDLLHLHQTVELKCEVGLIISNHQSATSLAEYYGIPFYYLPVTAEIKPEVEIEQLELLARHSVDIIVLASYIHLVSADSMAEFLRKIIN